ncbi:hypothetical protein [Microlunatus soli]|uniref:Uncharacterized protein n=1 Tax=Microlunatus soli TaxID=630515 RepID=A0A1H1RN14_9ACTN|nr:hypothetical protein [Microlunatus soli]SDS37023.1 hypothetical protein SAMN04489812_1707 [Microlunatus soli]
MSAIANPLLHQVLHRRRLRRRARLGAVCWALLGGLHIAVWWAAFEHDQSILPQPVLDAAVWPLLLAATGAFVVTAYYTARWFLAPGDPTSFEWLEQSQAGPGVAGESESSALAQPVA